MRKLFGVALAMLLLFFPCQVIASGCSTFPASGSFQLTGARSNGAVAVQFDVHSQTTASAAELIFRLRRPGEPVPVGTAGERRTISLQPGASTSYQFEFVPTTPGQYTVYAVVVTTGRGWRRGFEECLFIDVPANGGAPTISQTPKATTPVAGTGGPTAWDAARDRAACLVPDTPAPSDAPRAGAFKVTGTFKYTDRKYLEGDYTGTQALPIRNGFVRVLEVEPGDTTQLIGFTYTDSSGKFEYQVPDNSDGPANEGRRDIRLEVNADSVDAFVSYLDSTETRGANYGDFENWPGGELYIGTIIFDEELSGRFNIMDNAQKAQQFARGKGESTTRMRLKWEESEGSEVSFFKKSENAVTICGSAANPDDFDDDVILHECGHYMMNRFSFDHSPGGSHVAGGLYDPKLAWSEGWATYFGSMVDYNRYYVDHSATDFFAYNVETDEYETLGDRNEDSVTHVLWDIYDGPVDGVDTLSDGSTRSWSLFTSYFTNSHNCTFRDFYDGWKSKNTDFAKVEALAVAHGMTYSSAKVTYPTATGVAATVGSAMNIKWSGFPGANVRIDLIVDGNPNFAIIASTPNDGSYLWTPPSNTPLGPYARIRVYTTTQVTYYDLSDNKFHVYPKPAILALNTSKTGNLTGIGDEDWFSINITTSDEYTIKTFSGGLTDSYLTLWGPNSKSTKIAEDDDSGTGNMSQIIRTLAPGTYYMQVETITGGQSGTYSIRVSN